MLTELWRSRRPSTADLLVAGGFVVFGQLVTWLRLDDTWAFEGSRGLNAVLNLLMMAAMAWRRTMPVAAVAWVVVFYYVSYVVVPHDLTLLAGFVPLIVLTAFAGYFAPWRRSLVAAGLALGAVSIASLTTPWLRSLEGFVFNATVLLVPWLMARGLRQREQRAARLAMELVAERAAGEAAVREVVSEERARIARELHDIVAHSVSVMVVQIGAARMQLQVGGSSPETPLLDAEDVGRQALGDLRRMLGVLRDDNAAVRDAPETPQPGLSQLAVLAGQIAAAGLPVDVHVDGPQHELPAMLDLTAYRVVQESLTNALKHSGAERATVRVTFKSTALWIEVTDDGRGTAAAPGLPGHGLVGMRERVALFGGAVSAGPVEEGGWRVTAQLPVPVGPPVPATSDGTPHEEPDDAAVASA